MGDQEESSSKDRVFDGLEVHHVTIGPDHVSIYFNDGQHYTMTANLKVDYNSINAKLSHSWCGWGV